MVDLSRATVVYYEGFKMNCTCVWTCQSSQLSVVDPEQDYVTGQECREEEFGRQSHKFGRQNEPEMNLNTSQQG